MQFATILTFLTVGALASPAVQAPAKEVKCEIVHIDSDADGIDCTLYPSKAVRYNGTDNTIIKHFKEKTSHRFNCYVKGDKVKGIKAWDYANEEGCFVPGYYTDDKCTDDFLGKCAWWVDPPVTGGNGANL
ncbi:hypothetical protein G7Y89_g1109 [Cudoniella acicularis]|uniref:Uncharacterized protein n=1 Tax=Cudoniella acicularis TaxID=354080 RepID=A0A8H4RYS8_9HELO|nr:hypothetical protein G7Y89_g1109 [Cudoniella acicularis]